MRSPTPLDRKLRGTRQARSERQPRFKARQDGDGSDLESEDELETDNQYVKALGRGLDVLSAFKADDGALGNTELAERTGLPAATVSRITYTLAKRGYLTFNRRLRMYELGGETLAVGRVAFANLDVRRLAKPYMRDLADRSGLNVGLGTRDRQFMLYTDAFEGDSLIGLRLYAGSRIPIATTAMGRAYLVAIADDERSPLLRELQAGSSDWEYTRSGLERARENLEKHGFCVSLGDWQPDIHGVAAPIRTPDGDKVFVISLGGPANALPEDVIWNKLGEKVAEVARRVERAMAGERALL